MTLCHWQCHRNFKTYVTRMEETNFELFYRKSIIDFCLTTVVSISFPLVQFEFSIFMIYYVYVFLTLHFDRDIDLIITFVVHCVIIWEMDRDIFDYSYVWFQYKRLKTILLHYFINLFCLHFVLNEGIFHNSVNRLKM